jgi:hypothetical protein
MVLSPAGLRPEQDYPGKDQQQHYITDPSSRQIGRYKIKNSQLSEENFKEKESLVTGFRWMPGAKTDWPTDYLS